MKVLNIKGTSITADHNVVVDPVTHHPSIHVTVSNGAIATRHVMTIGAIDQPLPDNYDAEAMQKDLDAFVEKHATLLESKLRGAAIAKTLK